jgi:hypothetical protein
MGLFEAGRDFEEQRFAVNAGEKLQAGGKARRREAAGDGNGGNAAEVGGAIEAEEQGARGVILAGDGNIFLAD